MSKKSPTDEGPQPNKDRDLYYIAKSNVSSSASKKPAPRKRFSPEELNAGLIGYQHAYQAIRHGFTVSAFDTKAGKLLSRVPLKSDEDVNALHQKYPTATWGIVTGSASGVVGTTIHESAVWIERSDGRRVFLFLHPGAHTESITGAVWGDVDSLHHTIPLESYVIVKGTKQPGSLDELCSLNGRFPRCMPVWEAEKVSSAKASVKKTKAASKLSKALETAVTLASNGIAVFPCKPTRAPYTINGFKDATTDLETIYGWWDEYTDPLVGIPTGKKTGIVVIDKDEKGGKSGSKSIAELCLPDNSNFDIKTMNNGRHAYYAYPEGVGYIHCAQNLFSTGSNAKLDHKSGIDVRADGGYVVFYGSAEELVNTTLNELPVAYLDALDQGNPGLKANENRKAVKSIVDRNTETFKLTPETLREMIPDIVHCYNDAENNGMSVVDKQTAIEQYRNIQIEPENVHLLMKFDLDMEDAATQWKRRYAPKPNVIIENPTNGYAHYLYSMAVPVTEFKNSRSKPVEFFKNVYAGLAHRLNADQRYSGLICKNPFHPHWHTQWLHEENYTLHELKGFLSWEDMQNGKQAKRKLIENSDGRNCTLFDSVRKAVGENRKNNLHVFKKAGDREGFARFVQELTEDLNTRFEKPLSVGEVLSVSKSVVKWFWRTHSVERFDALLKEKAECDGVHKTFSERQRARIAKRWANRADGEVHRSTVWRHKKAEGASPLSDIGMQHIDQKPESSVKHSVKHSKDAIARAFDIDVRTVNNWERNGIPARQVKAWKREGVLEDRLSEWEKLHCGEGNIPLSDIGMQHTPSKSESSDNHARTATVPTPVSTPTTIKTASKPTPHMIKFQKSRDWAAADHERWLAERRNSLPPVELDPAARLSLYLGKVAALNAACPY